MLVLHGLSGRYHEHFLGQKELILGASRGGSVALTELGLRIDRYAEDQEIVF